MKPEKYESLSLRTKNILKIQNHLSRQNNEKNDYSKSIWKTSSKLHENLNCCMQTNDFNDVQTCKLEKHFSPKMKLQFNQDINYDYEFVARFWHLNLRTRPNCSQFNDFMQLSNFNEFIVKLLYLNCDKMKIFSIHSTRFWIEFHTTMQRMCERWIKFKLLRFRNQNCTHVHCRFN